MSSAIERKMMLKKILEAPTENDVKATTGKTLAHIGISVIGGSVASAIIGKPSFLIGILATGLGYYRGQVWLGSLGIGMMASSLNQEGETVQDRFKGLGKAFMSKTYLDKVVEKIQSGKTTTSKEETTNGIGTVQESVQNLDEIEQQLVAAAMEYQRKQKQQSTQRASNSENIEGFDNEPDPSRF